MTEKQKLLLQLFREVDAICKKHDLRYVMAGGTLIGVLRNEGFIPWDDDVDIYMPKSDWDKFVEICQNEMPPNRAIYCACPGLRRGRYPQFFGSFPDQRHCAADSRGCAGCGTL